jgi:hypothetical protein
MYQVIKISAAERKRSQLAEGSLDRVLTGLMDILSQCELKDDEKLKQRR